MIATATRDKPYVIQVGVRKFGRHDSLDDAIRSVIRTFDILRSDIVGCPSWTGEQFVASMSPRSIKRDGRTVARVIPSATGTHMITMP
jgi:hypothetical protein